MTNCSIAVHAGDGAAGARGDQARGVPAAEGRRHRQLGRAQDGGGGGALAAEGGAARLAPRLRRCDKVGNLAVM